MNAWAGYAGPGDESALRTLLGPAAHTYAGPGFGLGVRDQGGDRCALAVAADGRVTAAIAPHGDAGSSAAIDPSRRTLALSRDPFGFHGVYTTLVGEVLWCASDLRVLRRLREVASRRSGAAAAPSRRLAGRCRQDGAGRLGTGLSRAAGVLRRSSCGRSPTDDERLPGEGIDPEALHGYLCFSYVPAPLTLAAGIASLSAGSRMIVRWSDSGRPVDTRCEPQVTWRELPPLDLPEAAAVEELRERLRAAVALQAGAEREAGVFLSGGLDSSLVAALLVDAGVTVHLFTLDFGPPFDAEVPYARQVAAHLGRPLATVPARPEQVRAALEPTAAALEQPFGDAVTVPLYLLGQAAAARVSTVFNGEGGDQLFGGWTNKPLIAAELYGGQTYDREAAYLRTYHRFWGLTDRLYTPRAGAAAGAVDAGAWVRSALHADGFASLLHRLRAANLWLKGAQNIAPRAAQLAAAHRLSVRSPFFDRALAEWTFSLPPEWFLRGACEKYLLKRAAEPYLPPEVVWREKRGMGVPATEWCLGPLRREIGHRLGSRRLKRDGWFQPAAVEALRRGEDHPGEYRRRRVGEKLWLLLMLHVWRDLQEPPLAWPAPSLSPGGLVRA